MPETKKNLIEENQVLKIRLARLERTLGVRTPIDPPEPKKQDGPPEPSELDLYREELARRVEERKRNPRKLTVREQALRDQRMPEPPAQDPRPSKKELRDRRDAEHARKVKALCHDAKRNGAMAGEIVELAKADQALVATVNDEHSREIYSALPVLRRGAAVALHADTPHEEQSKIIKRFIDGKNRILIVAQPLVGDWLIRCHGLTVAYLAVPAKHQDRRFVDLLARLLKPHDNGCVRLLGPDGSDIKDWLYCILVLHRDQFHLKDLSHLHPGKHR